MGTGELTPRMERDVAARRQFRVLIVCTANICRSPLAERLLWRALDDPTEAGPPLQFVVCSAGTQGWDGSPMDPCVVDELRRLGGDPTGFLARSLQPTYCETADLILTATLEHRATVLQEVPRALKRTFTLLEFAHLVEHIEHVRAAEGDPAELASRAAAARGAAELEMYDVLDPYGAAPEFHQCVAEVIAGAVHTVAGALTGWTAR